MRVPLWILLIFALWFSACQEPLNIVLDDKELKVVAISNFSPDDYIKVYLSKEKPVNSDTATTYLSDARVRILLNDRLIEELKVQSPTGSTRMFPILNRLLSRGLAERTSWKWMWKAFRRFRRSVRCRARYPSR